LSGGSKEEVRGDCRCGQCCHLLVEVELEDALVEPKIKERCSEIRGLTNEVIGYLLNVKENDYACAFLDRQTNLYQSRPLACRLFDCQGEGREQLIELGYLPPRAP
jgi:Fe-S-cluster containining protein